MATTMSAGGCPYETLEIEKSASTADVKSAYRECVKKWHPDRLIGASPLELEKAKKMFASGTEAHAILSNPQRRRAYDLYGQRVPDSSLRSWRTAEHYNTSRKPFYQIAAKSWGSLFMVQGIITGLVLYAQQDSKDKRQSGELEGMHDGFAAHSREDINRRMTVVQERRGMKAREDKVAPFVQTVEVTPVGLGFTQHVKTVQSGGGSAPASPCERRPIRSALF